MSTRESPIPQETVDGVYDNQGANAFIKQYGDLGQSIYAGATQDERNFYKMQNAKDSYNLNASLKVAAGEGGPSQGSVANNVMRAAQGLPINIKGTGEEGTIDVSPVVSRLAGEERAKDANYAAKKAAQKAKQMAPGRKQGKKK